VRQAFRRGVTCCARLGVALAFFVSLTVGRPCPARADTGTAGTTVKGNDPRALAEARYEQGVEAYRNGRYVDAVRLFLDADTLSPSVALSFNIARAYEKIGDDAATLRWYRNYLRLKPNAPNRAEVSERIRKLSEALAGKGIQQLTVLSTPPGATVAIDGRAVGVTPLTIELAPGAHAALLTARGYDDAQRPFTLAASTPMDLAFELRASPLSQGGPLATSTPFYTQDGRRRFGVVPLVTIGAGIVALGGSLAFELSRSSAENAARNERVQRSFERDVDAMNDRQTVSRVLLGVGGVLLVTGSTLFVFNTKLSPDSSAVVSSLPGGARLSVSQSF
jgi:tetratricopeptide (TPR) repeat protein